MLSQVLPLQMEPELDELVMQNAVGELTTSPGEGGGLSHSELPGPIAPPTVVVGISERTVECPILEPGRALSESS